MGKSYEHLSLQQAQRLVLRAQGFSSTKPELSSSSATPTWRMLGKAINGMATVQIDAINTIIRSHYFPLFSRLGHYDRSMLDVRMFDPTQQTPAKRRYFEYWGHECSLLPIEYYSNFVWRMEDAKRGIGCYKQVYELAKKKRSYIKALKHELEQRGPSTSRELSVGKRGPGMWEWSESKQALEYLFWSGEVASVGRRGFERLYAVAEHAFSASLLNEPVRPRDEAQANLIEIAAKALGVATESDLRDYFRMSAKDAARVLPILVEQGRLVQVTVEGWKQPAFTVPGVKVPRVNRATAFLTPFDPLVWHRERTERLFNFHYRIEIYVPESRRQYGYYVLPFLFNGRLGARVDLKADRKSGQLLVLGAWSEVWTSEKAIKEELVRALTTELQNLRSWLLLNDIKVGKRGDLASRLRVLCNETIS